MLLFAGLGNPGPKHAGNRHNVGFMAADIIARFHGFAPWSKKFHGLLAEGSINGRKVGLLKPQTFMNLSGQSVGEALRFYKLAVADLAVFYDELDLAPGKVRVKTGGGAGGHNGIRSIDGHVGKDYRRIRIGIGHPGVKELVTTHVLGDFAKSDREWLDPLLNAIGENSGLLVEGDDGGFMNKISLALNPDKFTPQVRPEPAGRSHIRQARPQPSAVPPERGPMAAMLKRLFGNTE